MKLKTFLVLILIIIVSSSCSGNEKSIVGKWIVISPPKDFQGIESFVVRKEKDAYVINIMDIKDFPLTYNPATNEYHFRILGLGPDGEPEKLVPTDKIIIHYVLIDSKWEEDGRYSRVVK